MIPFFSALEQLTNKKGLIMKKIIIALLFLSSPLVFNGTEETEQIVMTSGPVELIWFTPQPEKTSAYIALLTSLPPGIDQQKRFGILNYCIKHNHWSAFEHAYMTVRITTSRAISIQLLRHRSFTWQQYSQRYGKSINVIGEALPVPELRKQKGALTSEQNKELTDRIKAVFATTYDLYKELLAAGVKSECARFILPEITPTKVHMTGNMRSWIHFIERCSTAENQEEMRVIALACKDIFRQIFPNTYKYLKQNRKKWGW
jgi:thymidylate synthase (FAD)